MRVFRNDGKTKIVIGHEGQIQIEKQSVDGVALVGEEHRTAVCRCGWQGPKRLKREDAIKDIETHIAPSGTRRWTRQRRSSL